MPELRQPRQSARENTGRAAMPGKLKRTLISAFVVFHIVAIACWALPLNTNVLPKAKQAIAPYMLWSGLFQAWDMFAPERFETAARKCGAAPGCTC